MLPFRNGRSAGGSSITDSLKNGNGGSFKGYPKNWIQEVEEKKKGWSIDPNNGGWIRESPAPNGSGASSSSGFRASPVGSSGGSSGSSPNNLTTSRKPTSLNKANSNLWNRRRTNSTTNIPNITNHNSSTSPINIHSSVSTTNLNDNSMNPMSNKGSTGYTKTHRGSSASPRMPHSKGFWVQEPEDIHQRWVGTNTPDGDTSAVSITSPLTWPPTSSGGRSAEGSISACSSQPSSPHKISTSPPALSSTLPKVFKSHATWVSWQMAKSFI